MCFPFHGVLLSAVSARLRREFYSAPGAEMLRKTALPIPRAADCRPYEVKTKTAFYHFHIIIKRTLVNGYIFRLQGFIYVDIKYPREQFCQSAGLYYANFWLYIGFSTQKLSVSRADFPIFPVGAATCRPPKTQSVFPIFFRVYAD